MMIGKRKTVYVPPVPLTCIMDTPIPVQEQTKRYEKVFSSLCIRVSDYSPVRFPKTVHPEFALVKGMLTPT